MVSMTMMALAPPVTGAITSRNRSAFLPTTTRTTSTTTTYATKGTSSAKPAAEKGFWETFFTGITKEEQLYETSPILKKFDDSNGSAVSSKTTKGTVAPPPPKKSGGFGGFGDLFAKK
ncbi:hypothetical protein MKW98_005275 [Papaver atlanticum]|uniref:Thylakoid soluble phosphoprotein TSP9 n=1 Tax=Papaver atlanticum TaxID=357466 RepID=A0AAD4RWF9_9MAGN|nr:hypothetical protein MKW98_005275 [Papaver atlanticum]